MITFPTLGRAPATLSVDLEPFQRSSGGAQVRSEALKGALWRLSLGYELLEEEDARLLEAFLAQAGASTFLLPSKAYSTQGPGVAAIGSSLTGNTVNVTLLEAPAAGSFLTVNGELKVVTKPPAGTLVTFAPTMRSVAAGPVTVVAGPTPLRCELDEGGSAVSYQSAGVYSITIGMLEVNLI